MMLRLREEMKMWDSHISLSSVLRALTPLALYYCAASKAVSRPIRPLHFNLESHCCQPAVVPLLSRTPHHHHHPYRIVCPPLCSCFCDADYDAEARPLLRWCSSIVYRWWSALVSCVVWSGWGLPRPVVVYCPSQGMNYTVYYILIKLPCAEHRFINISSLSLEESTKKPRLSLRPVNGYNAIGR